jgi:hypothetical protein
LESPASNLSDTSPPRLAGVISSRLRRHRGFILISLVIIAAMVLTIVTQLSPKADGTVLSTRNAAPHGGMAAAGILEDHGVVVQQTDTFQSTLSALDRSADSGEGGSTVLLYDPNGFLAEDRLQELLESSDRLVVVTPHFQTLRGLGGEIRQAGVAPEALDTVEPDCDAADPQAAGAISTESAFLYIGDNGDIGGLTCYRPAEADGGIYATTEDERLIVLGSTGIISNDLLDEHGNAALVLRTLGAGGTLIWYLPGASDIAPSDSPPTLDELAPKWVAFLGPWLALVALLSMFWRGRRQGPLVTEPLPVVVKAAETAEGRARLYHDARAVDRASESLRAGTLVRLAKSLRLGADAEPDDVVEAAARKLGRSPEKVAETLNGQPRTERHLVHWAQQLQGLEKEVIEQ